jgi:hypothetical protein
MRAMGLLAALIATAPAPDEKSLREEFSREIQSKEISGRVAAVKKISGAKEEETISLVAGHLNDEAKEVRIAVAETLEHVEDGAGAAVKPLAAVLVDKKADPDVRLACAKALATSKYKAGPIDAMVETICAITPEERHLHKFGANVTKILNKFTGEDFGQGKNTPNLWEQWWKDNKARHQKEDAARLEEYRKGQKK